MSISKKLLETAATEADEITRAVMEGVAREISGTALDGDEPAVPGAPDPYAAIAAEHQVDPAAFGAWCRKADLAAAAVALIDIADFRRGQS